MTRPRSELIDNQTEGIYHCVSRCVRRAFLHGKDPLTGNCYEHRKQWLHNRIIHLSEIFLVDICGYALMDNHLHSMLRNRPDLASQASDEEIARRWLSLSSKRSAKNNSADDGRVDELRRLVADKTRLVELRDRLCSISWFMRYLKEFIARKANKEDDCTGCFWEGRFKSTLLADDAAVMTCLAYVDLNPIRVGKAETPESSQFTSAQTRIRAYKERLNGEKTETSEVKQCLNPPSENSPAKPYCDDWLCPLQDTADRRGFLSLDLPEYLEILDSTGRHLVEGKPGAIPEHLPPILQRLEIDPNHWLNSVSHFGSLFFRVAGTETHMTEIAKQIGQNWLRGTSAGKTAFL